MKPERHIRATYADILDSADPATVPVLGDLDALYTSGRIPTAPSFHALLDARARSASRATVGDGPETAIRGIVAGGVATLRARRGWLRQGFALAGAALAFSLVASLLVLLFRSSDEASTPGTQPTISPAVTATTSNEILYVGEDAEGGVLYAARADGSGSRVVVRGDSPLHSPAWSPDGTRVAVSGTIDGERGIFVVNANGSGLIHLTDSGPSMTDLDLVWSPDGSQIAFRQEPGTNRQNLYLVNTDGSDLRVLVDSGDAGLSGVPSWSPNGRLIAFIKRAGNADADGFVHLVDPESGVAREVGGPVGAYSTPRWSIDGAQLLFTGTINDEPNVTIATIDGDSTNLTDGAGNDGFPTWSHDGRLIAFMSDRDGPNDLYIMNADGSDARHIAEVGGYSTFDWSPDGRSIVYGSFPGGAEPHRLFVVSIDGGEPRVIVEGTLAGQRQFGPLIGAQPDWSPVLALPENGTPEPSKTPPGLSLPTATLDTDEPPAPVTPNALDSMGQLQPGQERHFVFDISADYRLDESSFLEWNVKGSERMLPDGTIQTYAIVRDASNTVLIEYVNDGERWWWNQRGWIESGATERGVVRLPEELRIALQEPSSAWRALHTDELEVIDVRSEGDAHITRYRVDGMEWLAGQRFGIEVESAYYDIYSTIDLSQISRTRTVIVTPNDDERPEYALSDISFDSVVLIDAEDGPGNYVVPAAPADDTLQYTPPAILPGGLTIERHWREPTGGMELMTISDSSGLQMNAAILPSRGGHDPRPMRNMAALSDGHVVAGGFLAGRGNQRLANRGYLGQRPLPDRTRHQQRREP